MNQSSCLKNIEVSHTPILKQNKRILLWYLLKILLKITPSMPNMMEKKGSPNLIRINLGRSLKVAVIKNSDFKWI
jgi:hypothetical protein